MELVAPAGNPEKLKYAYLFGADAAYTGIDGFSLRARADNIGESDFAALAAVKGNKKLYCALNIFFGDSDIRELENKIDSLKAASFDAFIVSDVGIVSLLQKHFPETALHLSTQANCTNSAAARRYLDLGFSRLILARELSLGEIETIKKNTDVEIEVFCHGAMCLAYSGRCVLSAALTGRSANKGDCTHSCRWHYRVLEEKERPGEYFPVIEGENFTTILSSKDMCLFDHLRALRDVGVDAIKIEGRMKSVYYTAITTRAYRKALDKITGKTDEDITAYREELFKVSRREFSTGFLFGKQDIEKPTAGSYVRDYLFVGSIAEKTGKTTYRLDLKNQIRLGDELEYIGYDVLSLVDGDYVILDEEKKPVEKIDHGKIGYLKTDKPVKPGYLIRKKIKN